MRNDILTALKVIGRRTANGKAIEVARRHRLDLRVCDLSGADFSEGDYSGAMFHGCLIEFARFRGGLFHGTEFNESVITFAAFENGDFTGSLFCGVQISKPSGHTILNSFLWATVTGANFAGANISGVRSFGGVENLSQTFGTSDTLLADRFGWDKDLQYKLDDLHHSEASEDTASIQRLLSEKGLIQWSCFPRVDGAHVDHYNALMIQLDLCDFPFHGRRR
nr:pentapeptide repeat-containing protein [Phaeobacter italicus]